MTYYVRDIAALRAEEKIVFERHGLIHNLHDEDMHVDLLLRDKEYPDLNETVVGNITQQEVFASPELWRQIRTNQSEVYLHVVLLRTSPSKAMQTVVMPRDFQSGEALTGYVCLIKHDKVPRRYRHRYLLSDFGLVNVSATDGEVHHTILSVLSQYSPLSRQGRPFAEHGGVVLETRGGGQDRVRLLSLSRQPRCVLLEIR